MADTKTLVLDKKQVARKINRMAYQIYENHYQEKELIIVGVEKNGFLMAERLVKALGEISPFRIKLVKLTIDKKNPMDGKVEFPITKKEVENKTLVLVDDVLNSGKTLSYSLKHLLLAKLKAVRTVILVDRDHKRFPVKADYVGLKLATTLQEHITVKFGGKDEGVYLE